MNPYEHWNRFCCNYSSCSYWPLRDAFHQEILLSNILSKMCEKWQSNILKCLVLSDQQSKTQRYSVWTIWHIQKLNNWKWLIDNQHFSWLIFCQLTNQLSQYVFQLYKYINVFSKWPTTERKLRLASFAEMLSTVWDCAHWHLGGK